MTCKDCIHNDVCEALEMNGLAKVHPKQCGFYTDRSRYVELPCKVGDTLYVLSQTRDKRVLPFINKYEVTSITMRKKSISIFHEMDGHIKIFKQADIGKTVFLTKEEAEKALAERKGSE